MIKEKDFNDLKTLNEFLNANKNVSTISVETFEYDYDTGFPMPRGGTFVTKHQGKRLFYNES